MTSHSNIIFPAEWAEQDAIMLTWPGKGTDWEPILAEAEETYLAIAKEVIKAQKLLIVCRSANKIREKFDINELEKIRFHEMEYNDTWARDHGPIGVYAWQQPVVIDFGFNGWGNKFDARLDNMIPRRLFHQGAFSKKTQYQSEIDFILEGGSLESDGEGTLLTTSACLLNANRNPGYSKRQIEQKLSLVLGAARILWLDHGALEGDDTDSHIDTLARFCDSETITYVQCSDPEDPHYPELLKMEQQLKEFRTAKGLPYQLVALPMVPALYNDAGMRMGATYANFLIINNAVLMPTYGVPEDTLALQIIAKLFPNRRVVGINCVPLIQQNGSLHCITMQVFKDFLA